MTMGAFLWGAHFVLAESVTVSAVVNSACGNGAVESGEQCDGSNLAGQSCAGLGYSGGTLSCNANCAFNASACAAPSPPLSGGSGGGAGNFIPPAVNTGANFKGKAYPASDVALLDNGRVVATTKAGPDANFEFNLSNLLAGTHSFGIWAEDSKGNRSITHTFNIAVASGITTVISGIFLPPTITIDKTEVKKGDILTIFGQSVPNAQVSVIINSDEELIKKTSTDKNGLWVYKFDTDEADYGDHSAKSRGSYEADFSAFSQLVFFKVGQSNISAAQPKKCGAKGDLNNDCKVNLIDFSIAAYWYKKSLSGNFKKLETRSLNNDGKVDLIDFSIIAYRWTG
ncbi:hypothetical protein HY227_00900 [Candidatus Wolfebacteria bacterium]|nr:hypothetical protein [Candidatus Wolfebacteria bacterium]